MRRSQIAFLASVAMGLWCLAGCCSTCRQPRPVAAAFGPPAPCEACLHPPAPPASVKPYPLPAYNPGVTPPPDVRMSTFQPAPPGNALPPGPPAGVRLAAPEVAAAPPGPPAGSPPSDAGRGQTQLVPPQTPEPPAASIPPAAPPSGRGDSAATPPLPVDIPQFAMARPRVASGQQPMPDGVTWLQTHGYRTVLYVRAPGEDDAAAHRLFESNKLRYLSLEVSPRTLSREAVDQFIRIVNDEANLPLFVYDRDGSLAGGLWYLYFRLADKLDDERARAEAGRLGLRQEGEGSHRDMWIAIQAFLSAQKP